MQHDKHTYYFEKYLRKEMSSEEKEAFELKLTNDIAFKSDFESYAINHDAIKKSELAEYNYESIIPSKPKNYAWVWVLFSVLGLVLIIDYYANQKYNEEQKVNQTYKEAFVNRFNNAFVEPFKKITFKENIKTNNQQTTISADESSVDENSNVADTLNAEMVDSSLIEEKIIEQFQQLMKDKNTLSNIKDIFLNDSMLSVIELEKFKEKYKAILNSTDSILNDSIITRLAFQSIVKQNNNNNKPIFVEFWQSLVGFTGYQFTGKKLVIYGIQKPFDVFILKQNLNFILHTKWGETALEPDNQLHKFEN
ncbi:MAG: hypothetical protein ACOYMA_10360 [Bacteroidia bacterium]